jgi:hypothetical protein
LHFTVASTIGADGSVTLYLSRKSPRAKRRKDVSSQTTSSLAALTFTEVRVKCCLQSKIARASSLGPKEESCLPDRKISQGHRADRQQPRWIVNVLEIADGRIPEEIFLDPRGGLSHAPALARNAHAQGARLFQPCIKLFEGCQRHMRPEARYIVVIRERAYAVLADAKRGWERGIEVLRQYQPPPGGENTGRQAGEQEIWHGVRGCNTGSTR